MPKLKTALNVIGGGFKGARSCGALIYLDERNFVPEAGVFACSSGALCSLPYAQGQIDVLRKLWMTIRNKNVRNFRPFFAATSKASIYDFTPLRKTIQNIFRPDLLAKAKWTTSIAVTDLQKQSTVRNQLNGLSIDVDLLLASASIPVYVPAVDDHLVDGGVSDNYGIEAAILAGATRIILIHPDIPQAFGGYRDIRDSISTVITQLGWSIYQAEKMSLGFVRQPNFKVSQDPENYEHWTYKTTRERAVTAKNGVTGTFRSLVGEDAEIELIEIIPKLDKSVTLFNFDYPLEKRAALIQSGYDAAKAALDSIEI